MFSDLCRSYYYCFLCYFRHWYCLVSTFLPIYSKILCLWYLANILDNTIFGNVILVTFVNCDKRWVDEKYKVICLWDIQKWAVYAKFPKLYSKPNSHDWLVEKYSVFIHTNSNFQLNKYTALKKKYFFPFGWIKKKDFNLFKSTIIIDHAYIIYQFSALWWKIGKTFWKLITFHFFEFRNIDAVLSNIAVSVFFIFWHEMISR